MIDFHCHLDLYPNPLEVVDETQKRNVGVLSVTNTPSAWRGTSRLAIDRPAVRTALGLHPQLAKERKHELHLFEQFLPETRFVGEVGLDGSPEFVETWEAQLEVFDVILDACASTGDKIVSIHSRRSATAVLDRLEQRSSIGCPILHWFSGTKAELSRAIALDCWYSVGPAMLAGAKGRNLVSSMPRNRVLLETDGPFAQVGRKPLFPWNADIAVSRLSDVWGVQPDAVTGVLSQNERSILC
jgi:TatD DNase family protein